MTEPTSERFIGTMWYKPSLRKLWLPYRPGVSWPLAELVIDKECVSIQPRFALLRRLFTPWHFTLDEIDELRHRPTPLGRLFVFYLNQNRQIGFRLFSETGARALYAALEKRGIQLER